MVLAFHHWVFHSLTKKKSRGNTVFDSSDIRRTSYVDQLQLFCHYYIWNNIKNKIIGVKTIGYSSSAIKNVIMVDKLNNNLISINHLWDKGYDVQFFAAYCLIKLIEVFLQAGDAKYIYLNWIIYLQVILNVEKLLMIILGYGINSIIMPILINDK